jgi:O-methyltransferase involved in polyketide biosynthesis
LEGLPSGLRTESLDVLADPSGWRDVLARHFDLAAPVVVIAEGLLQYLTPDQMRRSWASMLTTFSGSLVYLANMTLQREGAGAGSVRALHALLGALVGRKMWTHFDSEATTVSALREAGFSGGRLHAPGDLVAESNGASAVQWIVEATRDPIELP